MLARLIPARARALQRPVTPAASGAAHAGAAAATEPPTVMTPNVAADHAAARQGGTCRHHDATAPCGVSVAKITRTGRPPRRRSETGMTPIAEAAAADGSRAAAAVSVNRAVRR